MIDMATEQAPLSSVLDDLERSGCHDAVSVRSRIALDAGLRAPASDQP
jgi:hypothetical protein